MEVNPDVHREWVGRMNHVFEFAWLWFIGPENQRPMHGFELAEASRRLALFEQIHPDAKTLTFGTDNPAKKAAEGDTIRLIESARYTGSVLNELPPASDYDDARKRVLTSFQNVAYRYGLARHDCEARAAWARFSEVSGGVSAWPGAASA